MTVTGNVFNTGSMTRKSIRRTNMEKNFERNKLSKSKFIEEDWSHIKNIFWGKKQNSEINVRISHDKNFSNKI